MQVGIVGLGLIGASIGMGLRRWPSVGRILGHDGYAAHEAEALRLSAVDRCVELGEIAQCDLVFVAVPPDAVIKVLEYIEQAGSPETIVTDCTSVKLPVTRWSRARKRKSWFVPGHPMGGTEHSGPTHADAVMFEGKPWILTPPKSGGQTAFAMVEAAVRALGSKPIVCDAAIHDRQVALLSHLPHVLAAALLVQSEMEGVQLPSGGSWRDATRVGGSNPDLWTQILLSNRKEVLDATNTMISELSSFRNAVKRRNIVWLQTFFGKAAEAKRKRGNA